MTCRTRDIKCEKIWPRWMTCRDEGNTATLETEGEVIKVDFVASWIKVTLLAGCWESCGCGNMVMCK